MGTGTHSFLSSVCKCSGTLSSASRTSQVEAAVPVTSFLRSVTTFLFSILNAESPEYLPKCLGSIFLLRAAHRI